MITADSRLLRFGAAIRLRAVWSYTLPSDRRGDSEFVTTIRRIIRVVTGMIGTILDACREVLEINGDPQSAYWLASQMMEMRMWRASEHAVRAALDKDIRTQGERLLFVEVAGDENTLRAWTESLR
jgi:hypothetical protein